jgi:cell filamentation protein
MTPEDFAREAGVIMGDVNYVHPFREGNGRTQMFWLEELARQAGHPLDLPRIHPNGWIEASRAAHTSNYGLMAQQVGSLIE